MSKIVANFTSFTRDHKVVVYQDGDIIEEIKVMTEDMPSVIKGLKTKYSVEEIDLVGNPSYLKKIQEKLGTDFSQTEIKVITL